MKKVGAYEAKTHLPGLLKEVGKGARITITRNGIPVALLVPASPAGPRDTPGVIRMIREFRKGITRGDLSIREMIEEGRRF